MDILHQFFAESDVLWGLCGCQEHEIGTVVSCPVQTGFIEHTFLMERYLNRGKKQVS